LEEKERETGIPWGFETGERREVGIVEVVVWWGWRKKAFGRWFLLYLGTGFKTPNPSPTFIS
jgi:hypothetical protein